jgi:hypothetical protein
MPLTPDERKRKLGFGGLTKVAKKTRRALGHVSQVNAEGRRDPKVERAITREILKRDPAMDPAAIWPEEWAVAQVA